MSSSTNDALAALRTRLARRHALAGWSGLILFLSLGGVLEGLHGFKVGSYLDPDHKVRRELWTLAHAHGTLLALVQLTFAAGLPRLGRWTEGRLRLASILLVDAAFILPAGFFLGGIGHAESDPSWGILLVPFGALLLFLSVALILNSVWRDR